MILRALTDYYEALNEKGMISRPGWASVKISWALELDHAGRINFVHPLKQEVPSGKKTKLVARVMNAPAPVKRTAGVVSNFLWDNSAFVIGADAKGKPERAVECFQAMRKLHEELLGGVDHPTAKAVCAYFENWDVSAAKEHPVLQEHWEDLLSGDNLTFMVDGVFVFDIPEIRRAWQKHYDGGEEGGEEEEMRCLVTGDKVLPTKTHPAIKGVVGAQSSGAALVSFNVPSFCSYGREQNLNAPVGKYAAFAYTTAMNYLLATRNGDGKPRFSQRLGEMTVLYWAEDGEEAYQDITSLIWEGGDENRITHDELAAVMRNLAQGNPVAWGDTSLKPENKFYLLGLSPNAGRLSVRFFEQCSFGDFARHMQEHYDRLSIVKPAFDKWEDIPLWKLLQATVNQKSQDKTPSPQMTGDTLQAVLTGGRYPATLYQQAMLRTHAENDLPRTRAAIIKAYLLRNGGKKYKEVATVELNESTTYQPYVLGRIFSVLEEIQEKANPGLNTTIKDKYFSSASATPASVFPTLVNLAQKHLRKIEGAYYTAKLGKLLGMLTESYPVHMSLYDQGIFQLGYYHQTQKRYEKKNG